MIKPLIGIALIIVIVLLASNLIIGQLPSFRLISSKGNVKVFGVGVYWDANCTRPVNPLDWGSVEPDSKKNETVFIRNEGNEPSTLFLATGNWTFRDSNDKIVTVPTTSYMNLTWNYNNETVYPNETIEVTLILSISSSPDFIDYVIANDVKRFDFEITIGVND